MASSPSSPRQTPLKSALKHSNHPTPISTPVASSPSQSVPATPFDSASASASASRSASPISRSAKSSNESREVGDDTIKSNNTVTFGDEKPWVMVENVDQDQDGTPKLDPNPDSKSSSSSSSHHHHHHHHHHHLHGFFHRHSNSHPSNSNSISTTSSSSSSDSPQPNSPNPTQSASQSASASQSQDLPSTYERKVGFDTMPDADDTVSHTFSFTLQARSKGYRRSNNTRTFMCAVDGNHYSERALEWLVEELCEDGDEIVALRVLEGGPEEIDQDEAREEARDLLASIVDLNEEVGDRKISIIVEFIAGRTTSTIIRLIHMYRPDSLTVGTRGKSTNAIQRVLGGATIGSVSRDVLSRSPVPVVVVRPTAKVKKHLKKRQADPKRRSYHDLIRLTQQELHHHHPHHSNKRDSPNELSHSNPSLETSSNPNQQSPKFSTIPEDGLTGEGILRSHSPLPMSVSRSKRESLGLEGAVKK